jgi:hypothetical protein
MDSREDHKYQVAAKRERENCQSSLKGEEDDGRKVGGAWSAGFK